MPIVLQPRLKKYRDLDLNFSPHPITGDVGVLVDDVAVERAMKNIVFLQFYEKPFHPEIGCGIRQSLFDNFNPLTSIAIQKNIETAILNNEPRVKVKGVQVKQADDENSIIVSIVYNYLNTPEPRTLTVFMKRLR